MSKRLSFRVQVTTPLGEVLLNQRLSVTKNHRITQQLWWDNSLGDLLGSCKKLGVQVTLSHDMTTLVVISLTQLNTWVKENFI